MDQLVSLIVPTAYADVPSAAPQSAGGMSFIMMFAVFFVFAYFFIWRPQNKRARETQTMLDALQKGDEVVTAGGLVGRISKLTDQYIGLAVNDSVEITMQKNAVTTVLPKGTLKAIN